MFTIKQMGFKEAHQLLKESTEAHWDEVPFGPFQMELELDTDMYLSAQSNGNYLLLVAFDGDRPVGYFSVLAATMLQHKGVWQATTDAYYVHPDYREAGVFQELLNALEVMCDQHNIRFLSVGLNPNTGDIGRLQDYLTTQSFHVTEITMTKEIT